MYHVEHPSTGEARLARIYSPDLQPLLQTLLATLADLDIAFEADLKSARNTTRDETLRRKVIEKLYERHGERRFPYVRQLEALQEQVKGYLGSRINSWEGVGATHCMPGSDDPPAPGSGRGLSPANCNENEEELNAPNTADNA